MESDAQLVSSEFAEFRKRNFFFVFIETLFKMLLFKGGVLIYAEHCM